MARPIQEGCSYFPLDCDYFQSRKVRLLRAELGARAELVLIRLWCEIYSGNGWYTTLGSEEMVLLAAALGKGFPLGFVQEVVRACCRRGLFDEGLYARHRVLTGVEVQKRYLSTRCRRITIPVLPDYWLLTARSWAEENPDLARKLRYLLPDGSSAPVFAAETPTECADGEHSDDSMPPDAAKTPQRKEKKSTGNQSELSAPGAGPARDQPRQVGADADLAQLF